MLKFSDKYSFRTNALYTDFHIYNIKQSIFTILLYGEIALMIIY